MNRSSHRIRLVMSAFGLALLLSFWLVAREYHSYAALQPLAPVTMDLRRKMRSADVPLYIIEWVMPERYRRALGLWAI